MSTFPMMVNPEGKKVYVCGSGKRALDKIKKLEPFGANIKVFTENKEIQFQEMKNISIIKRELMEEDFKEPPLFLIAASDKDENRRIYKLSKKYRVPVNTVDEKDYCDFIFPSILKRENLVIAVSSGGISPTAAIFVKNKIDEILPDTTDEIVSYMPKLKKIVNNTIQDKELRKKALMELFSDSLKNEKCPDKEKIDKILKNFKNMHI